MLASVEGIEPNRHAWTELLDDASGGSCTDALVLKTAKTEGEVDGDAWWTCGSSSRAAWPTTLGRGVRTSPAVHRDRSTGANRSSELNSRKGQKDGDDLHPGTRVGTPA